MAASSPSSIRSLLPHSPHSATICGQTGCGKTVFALDLLEGPYRGVFHHIVTLCPTIRHNTTYQGRPWIWGDPEIYIVDPGERLHDWLRFWYHRFKGEPTLFIIDATPSNPSGCCLSVTIRSSKTCVNRPSGWLCSTVRTETLSRSASGRTTS